MKQTAFIFILSFWGSLVWGQLALTPTVIAPAGNSYGLPGSILQVSYTIGEMTMVSTLNSGILTLTQGFHQPEEFSTGIFDVKTDDYGSVELYPVPASDYLMCGVEFPETGKLEIKITDILGRVIQDLPSVNYASGKCLNRINTAMLISGTYFLEMAFVTAGSQTHQTGKPFLITK